MKTILSAILFVSVLFTSCTFSSSTSTSSKTSTTTRTFNGGKLLYNETITEAEANALGAYLIENEFYDGQPIVAQVAKINNVIHFSMIMEDKEAYSDEYQAVGVAMVEELEQKVFKGSTVEVDYCDGHFNVKKNIKGDTTTAVVLDEETPEPSNEANPYAGTWYCTNIAKADETDESAAAGAADLEVLRKNFIITFNADNTFESAFINQADVRTPIDLQGGYKMDKDKITFINLMMNGKQQAGEMIFEAELEEDQLYLVSSTSGQSDLVMSFAKGPIE